MEPERNSVIIRGYSHDDLNKEAAIDAVPDSNGIASGHRDPIALR